MQIYFQNMPYDKTLINEKFPATFNLLDENVSLDEFVH